MTGTTRPSARAEFASHVAANCRHPVHEFWELCGGGLFDPRIVAAIPFVIEAQFSLAARRSLHVARASPLETRAWGSVNCL